MRNTDISDTNMRNTDIRDTNMRNTDIRDMNIRDTDMRDTNMSRVIRIGMKNFLVPIVKINEYLSENNGNQI